MNSPRVPGHELIQRIGSGGMAQVWMARRRGREGMSKVVALKFPTSDHEETLRLFAREARLSALLSHSNIVQVFDVGETEEGRPYLVMEWVDGLNLAQLISGWRRAKVLLPIGVCTFVAAELLKALDYAHNLRNESGPLQIVHRDISPQNVLVSISGEVKLTDFGIARASLDETAGVVVRGKLRYMPAEQLLGRRVDKTADLYAVGAILWELLAGRPFRGDAGEEALYSAALNGEIPKVDRGDLPMVIEALIEGLLAHEPTQRIGNAKEALALLYKAPQDPAAAQVLEAACRSLIGVQGPRSGIVDAIVDTASPSQSAPVRAARSASASGAAAAVRAGLSAPHAAARSASNPSSQSTGGMPAMGERPGPAIGGEEVVADATQTLAAPMSEAQTLVQTPPRRESAGRTPRAFDGDPNSQRGRSDLVERGGEFDPDSSGGATVTRHRPASASQSAAMLAAPASNASLSASPSSSSSSSSNLSSSSSLRALDDAATSRQSGVLRAESSDRHRVAPAVSIVARGGDASAPSPGWLMPLLLGGVGVAIVLLAWNLAIAGGAGRSEREQASDGDAREGVPQAGAGELLAGADRGGTTPSDAPPGDAATGVATVSDATGTAQNADEELRGNELAGAGALASPPLASPPSDAAAGQAHEDAATPSSVLADGVAATLPASTLGDGGNAPPSGPNEPPQGDTVSASSPGQSGGNTKSSASKVEVTLANGDFKTAYVRIGKREYVLEPRLATQLSTGKHKFSVRADPQSAWAAAGTVELEKGKKYKLIMRDGPPHVEVVEL